MAIYFGNREVVINDVPVVSQDYEELKYCNMDVQDETTGKWWGLYKRGNELFRGKVGCESNKMK